jgi:hypothetical protein
MITMTEHGSQDFEDFLDLLGDRIELRGWSGFRGGLDVRSTRRLVTDIRRRDVHTYAATDTDSAQTL